MNKVNLRRGAKYFLMLCVLYVVIVTVLCATGMSAVPVERMGYELTRTWRGGLLLLMALGLAYTYPLTGFVRRKTEAAIDRDRDVIVSTFAAAGFVLTNESEQCMTFRAASAVRRLRLLWEDEIRVSRDAEGGSVIDGIRRVAVPVALRIEAAVRNR